MKAATRIAWEEKKAIVPFYLQLNASTCFYF